MKYTAIALATAIAPFAVSLAAKADTTQARCDVYPRGSDQVSSYGPCTFSQRQGYVTITLEDGTRYELAPSPTEPYTFTDQDGQPATVENGGLGESGLIYRLADESIFVYWNAADTGSSSDSAVSSDPRRGGGYIPCSIVEPTYDMKCEADALYSDSGNASFILIGVTGTEHHLAYFDGALHSIDPGDKLLSQYLEGRYLININDEEFFELDEIMVTGVD